MTPEDFTQDFVTPPTQVVSGVWLIVSGSDRQARTVWKRCAYWAAYGQRPLSNVHLTCNHTDRSLRMPTRSLQVMAMRYPESGYQLRGLDLAKVLILDKAPMSHEAMRVLAGAHQLFR